MIRVFVSTILVLLGAVSIASAGDSYPLDERLSDIANDSVIRRNSSPIQTFHIARFEHSSFRWRVYWPEARLLLWVPEGSSEATIALISEFFDLETGVVNTQKEIGTSTYLVDGDWARGQIEAAIDGRILRVAVVVPERAEDIQ